MNRRTFLKLVSIAPVAPAVLMASKPKAMTATEILKQRMAFDKQAPAFDEDVVITAWMEMPDRNPAPILYCLCMGNSPVEWAKKNNVPYIEVKRIPMR